MTRPPSPDSYQKRYFADTIQLFTNAAIILPLMVIVAMSFVAIGWVQSAVFNEQAYFILSAGLIFLSLLRALAPTSRALEWFLLLSYQVVGALLLLFVTGFDSPFTIFWLAIILGSYVRFGILGFMLSSAFLLATAGLFAVIHAPQSLSFYVSSSFYSVFIITMGYVLAKVMQFDARANTTLEHTRSQETIQRDRLDTLLNSIAEGVVTVDPAGTITLQNAAILALLDTNESTIGKNLDDVLKLVDENNTPVRLSSLLKSGGNAITRTDLSHHFEGLDLLRLSIQITPIRTSFRGFGEPGFVLILRDITKEKTLEEERDEFISVVSHELRTPVTIAEGSTSNLLYMQQKGVDSAALTKAAETAHDQVLYLAKMVNDLSTLSRAERGVGDQHEEINLNELFENLFKKYTPEAEKKGLHLNLDVAPALPAVTQSRLYLEEILQNFITNAIKYTTEGSVTIHAQRTANGVECAVSDTGIGISKSDQTKIFQKFYRSEDYRTRETSGTGLGLYVVKKLASKMGLEIIFKSRLNHGSRFGFILPVTSKKIT